MTLQAMQARDWLQGVWLSSQVSYSPLLAVHCRLAAMQSGYTAAHPNYTLRNGGGASVSTSNALGSSMTMSPSSSSSSSSTPAAVEAERAFLSARSTAFRRLSLANIDSPAEAVDNAPQDTAFLCLQCDPLKEALYVSVGMKGAANAASAAAAAAAAPSTKGGKAAAAAPVEEESNSSDGPLDSKDWVIDKMKLEESTRRSLLTLTAQHTVWKADVSKFVATYGELASPDFDLERSSSSSSSDENQTMRQMERALDERLRALLEDMSVALAPLLGPDSICAAFIRDVIFSTSGATGAAALPNLVLLLDTSLQSLPFEGLDCFAPCKGKVCREFSIHLFQHRLTALSSSPAAAVAAAAVSAANMKYLVDSLEEDEGCAVQGMQRDPLRAVFQQSLSSASASASGKWTNDKAGQGNVTVQDFISAVDASSSSATASSAAAANGSGAPPLGLVSCTVGRFSSLLLPTEISSLNLEKLAFFGCFDMSLNDLSSRRQISADVQKSQKELLAEQSINSAALLSLCGVGSMVAHSWSTPLCAQNRFLGTFLKEFLSVASKNNVLASVSKTYAIPPPTSNSSSSAAGGIGGEGAAAAERELQVKKWIRLSRVVVGLPTVTYTE